MKATGIVRRIDDLGRVVIPKEIRRTMRIREGDPLLTTLTPMERTWNALLQLAEGAGALECGRWFLGPKVSKGGVRHKGRAGGNVSPVL